MTAAALLAQLPDRLIGRCSIAWRIAVRDQPDALIVHYADGRLRPFQAIFFQPAQWNAAAVEAMAALLQTQLAEREGALRRHLVN